MKTATDPRHLRRRNAVKFLFAESFTHQKDLPDIVKNILKQTKKLNTIIEKSAPTWPIDKINKIDLAILHLAIYELNNEDTPPKVVIDEAVELAKEFGSESSGSFVNGVLGTVFDKIDKKEEK
ncbi:MAG TPA: transcription antitermination factor NusB [Patescibacteria group bacterium]|nr:transcription antitermination factor NusB [Patescibacteria group bacterium]